MQWFCSKKYNVEEIKILVIGASTNPARYSFLAVHSLRRHNYKVVALAKREGKVADIIIQTDTGKIGDIHTVTLYIGPERQPEYYEFLIQLNPKRVIFNPGTENSELAELLENNGIETLEACTLVMLNTGQF